MDENGVRCVNCSNSKITEPFGDLKCTVKNHESIFDFFLRNDYTYCGEYKKGTPQVEMVEEMDQQKLVNFIFSIKHF